MPRCCWDALQENAREQAKHQATSEPAGRFIVMLSSALASGRAHLASRRGTAPQLPESCGWRRGDVHPGGGGENWWPQGACVGWVEDDDIYLAPTNCYQTVQLIGRDVGYALPITEQTLKKRLHQKGFLASTDGRRDTLTI